MKENSKKKKEVTIIVNGKNCVVEKGKISFEQIITIAFGSYEPNPDVAYTVTYSKGPGKKPKGQMVEGDKVNVKDGMIFNASKTNRS